MSKTLEEKLTAAVALVAKYRSQIAAIAISNNIAVDDDVVVKFGRGDKVRNVAGRVIGVRDTEQGRVVAVIDENLDTFKVNVRDVVSNTTADARNAASEAGGEPDQDQIDTLVGEGGIDAEGAAGDPLSEA